jgi:hypothetical protein
MCNFLEKLPNVSSQFGLVLANFSGVSQTLPALPLTCKSARKHNITAQEMIFGL